MTSAASGAGRPRVWLLAVAAPVALVVIVATILTVRQRTQRRLPESLRARAAAAGATLRFGAVRVIPWATTLRDIKVTFATAPGVKATADVATLNAAGGDWPQITCETVHLTIGAGALFDLEGLVRQEAMRALPLTWRHMDVTYVNRLTGPVHLEDVTVDARVAAAAGAPGRTTAALVVHAARVTVGDRRWSDVTMALQRRGQMLEIGLGLPVVAGAPVVLGVFAPQGQTVQFIATLAHPPAALLADALAVGLSPSLAGARLGGSLSFTIPDDVTKPIVGRAELVMNGWPAPASPEAATVFGQTVALGARLVPAPDRESVTLEPARMSTSLFSLAGTGRLLLGRGPRLSLELSGSLTCAQLRGNLPPSTVLTQVSAYLDSPPAPGARPGRAAATRAAEKITMRIQLDAPLAHTDTPDTRLGWKVDPACGFAGFTFGAFTAGLLPAPAAH